MCFASHFALRFFSPQTWRPNRFAVKNNWRNNNSAIKIVLPKRQTPSQIIDLKIITYIVLE
ncbi:MAG: hypothetical protein ACI9XB_004351 [Gammaproteobacteria bacterium]|jgi:hypothetical protein